MNSKSLWLYGLILIVVASLVNGLLMSQGIGSIVRELARLSILIGVGLFIFGIIRNLRKQ